MGWIILPKKCFFLSSIQTNIYLFITLCCRVVLHDLLRPRPPLLFLRLPCHPPEARQSWAPIPLQQKPLPGHQTLLRSRCFQRRFHCCSDPPVAPPQGLAPLAVFLGSSQPSCSSVKGLVKTECARTRFQRAYMTRGVPIWPDRLRCLS